MFTEYIYLKRYKKVWEQKNAKQSRINNHQKDHTSVELLGIGKFAGSAELINVVSYEIHTNKFALFYSSLFYSRIFYILEEG